MRVLRPDDDEGGTRGLAEQPEDGAEEGTVGRPGLVVRRRAGAREVLRGEALVGSADIQSLADLGNSYEVVKSMRVLPVTRDGILRIVAATLLPVAPLALPMMPLEDLLKTLVGIVL